MINTVIRYTTAAVLVITGVYVSSYLGNRIGYETGRVACELITRRRVLEDETVED